MRTNLSFTDPRAVSPRRDRDRGVTGPHRSTVTASFVSLLGLLLWAGACDSSDGKAGTTRGVWTQDATQVVVADLGGGFTGPAPTDSQCGSGVARFTFTAADSGLAWHVCTAGAVYAFTDGARTLSAAEHASFVTTLKAVTVSTGTTCGADKSTLQMTVTRPGGEATYLDSFYACLHQGTYVDGLDDVLSAVRILAK